MATFDPKRSLALVLPGLAGTAEIPSPPRGGLSLPALDIALARADRLPAEPAPPEALLFRLFDYAPGDADLPVAAVTHLADLDGPPGGWWLRADPVHLRADRDTLVFTGPVTDLSSEEAAGLAGEVDSVFLPRGWHLFVGDPARWYLRLSEAPLMRTHMPTQAMGRDVRALLPYGQGGARWHVLMNEVQMQLHMSPVNREREARGAAAVNSLWFWGGGRLPRLQGRWTALWCDDVLSRGLARVAAVPSRPVPPDARQWLEGAEAGTHAVVITALYDALAAGDAGAWQARLQALHDAWLAPMIAALRRGDVSALTVTTGGRSDLSLDARALRRWWRRAAPPP